LSSVLFDVRSFLHSTLWERFGISLLANSSFLLLFATLKDSFFEKIKKNKKILKKI